MNSKNDSLSNTRSDCDEGIEYYNAGEYDKALPCFVRGANSGDPVSACYLGFCYDFGYGVDVDFVEAVKWYKISADRGDARAQFDLGCCYERGRGVEKDYVEAVKWYRRSAEQGNSDAQSNLGVCYEDGTGVEKDCAEAVKWYRRSADRGNSSGLYNLALCYAKGIGVEIDHVEAVKLFTKSADLGSVCALHGLGVCYLKGNGVGLDYAKALDLFKQVAAHGYSLSMRVIGGCYEKGRGVAVDHAEAVKWYRLSWLFAEPQSHIISGLEKLEFHYLSDGNESKPKDRIYKLVKDGKISAELAEAPLDAEPWFSIAKQFASVEVLHKIATVFFTGVGVAKFVKDEARALELFLSAAKRGHAPSQVRVGAFCYYGYGRSVDYDEAFSWFSRAYKGGDGDAREWLEQCYENGHGVERDPKKAAELLIKMYETGEDAYKQSYRERLMKLYAGGEIEIPDDLKREYDEKFRTLIASAEQGNVGDQYFLARHYETGDWGILDYELALKWYREGARHGDPMCKTAISGVKELIKERKRADKLARKNERRQ